MPATVYTSDMTPEARAAEDREAMAYMKKLQMGGLLMTVGGGVAGYWQQGGVGALVGAGVGMTVGFFINIKLNRAFMREQHARRVAAPFEVPRGGLVMPTVVPAT